jgi:hypothetical protein
MIAELFAAIVYWPLARLASPFGGLGADVANWPFSAYPGAATTTCLPMRSIGSVRGWSTG